MPRGFGALPLGLIGFRPSPLRTIAVKKIDGALAVLNYGAGAWLRSDVGKAVCGRQEANYGE